MPAKKKLSADRLVKLFMGERGQSGLYEQALGFKTATGAYKGVHLMNDLAQSVLGGSPEHRGDLLCSVIREDKLDEKEDNRDETLRASEKFGEVYGRAYPQELGSENISRLREAARLLLNFDGGMYRAGDGMASGLATHWTLLGSEGFRRFQIGRYLQTILGQTGQEKLRALFREDRDPVSQALRPLLWETPLREDQAFDELPVLSKFDEALGARLATLLQQPLSKPMLLRAFLSAASLGIILKILGVGRSDGRPVALALPAVVSSDRRPLRQEAVQSLQRGLDALDQKLAEMLPHHPSATTLWEAAPERGEASVEVVASSIEDATPALVDAVREQKSTYTPHQFAISLGKQVGCVQPKTDRAGWGKRLVLHADLLEAIILMYVPDGATALPWARLWASVRDELGLVIGANEYTDMLFLTEGGILQVNMEELSKCSDTLLAQAVTRGVARHLPDDGAEAGGALL
jgi:hypothetical protein